MRCSANFCRIDISVRNPNIHSVSPPFTTPLYLPVVPTGRGPSSSPPSRTTEEYKRRRLFGHSRFTQTLCKNKFKLSDIHINLVNLLIDILYPIYSDPYNLSKAETMNREIQARLSKIQKLGLSVPEYVTTGEKIY